MHLKLKKIKQFIDEKIMSKSIIRIALLIVLILSLNTLSYAYFNAQVEGTGKQMVMTTSNMRIVFQDSQSINATGMIPGDSVTKTFTVTNQSDSSVDYKINWEYLINNFVNKEYLVYTVTSTNSGGSLTQSQVPDGEEHINIINNITIASGVTQEYTLTVTYLDSGNAQDEDTNKSLIGKIEVTDLDGNSILPETSTGPSSSPVALERNLYGLTVKNLMDEIYPVGSIYLSMSSANPSVKFGGTWIPYGEGRTIMGVGSIKENTDTTEGSVTAGAINKTTSGVMGGANTHTLSATQIPGHTHSIPALSGTALSNGAHTHRYSGDNWGVPLYKVASSVSRTRFASGTSGGYAVQTGTQSNLAFSGRDDTQTGGAHTHSVTTTASTSGTNNASATAAHNNIQPYVTVYMWQRTN